MKLTTSRTDKIIGVKRLVLIAVFISQALVIHYIESFMPILMPGAKLGLSNIITMMVLILLSPLDAFIVVVIRSILGSLLVGNVIGIMYSLTGGILSWCIMSILYTNFRKNLSFIGISVYGAIFFNLGQISVAALVYSSIGLAYTYLPMLMFSSVVTGTFIGFITYYLSIKVKAIKIRVNV